MGVAMVRSMSSLFSHGKGSQLLMCNFFPPPTGYIAGFVDPEVSNRSDLFDVYVNLPDSIITVSQSAKGAVNF